MLFKSFFFADAISKRSKIEFFWKTMTFFCEWNLEKFQEHYLASFIEIACQTFILLRNSQNNRIFGLFGEIDVVFEKILFFSRIGKRGIFIPACVSKKNKKAQANWKRSTAWDFRESRLVIWKNCLNFLKIADIGKISIKCVSNGFFA